MARKKGLVAAAAAFAASPQGRKLLQQAKQYAAKPENREKAKQLLADVRARRKGGITPSRRVDPPDTPSYGTPPTP